LKVMDLCLVGKFLKSVRVVKVFKMLMGH
jgi:hypothetical protein